MKRITAHVDLQDLLALLVLSAVAAVLIGGAVFALTRPSATERAADAVEDKGYTVTSTKKDWKFFDHCSKTYTRVVVDAVKNERDVTLEVCVGTFDVKVRD